MQNETKKDKIWAIVPAAGCGERMQAAVAKQYLQIDGKTILEITLALLLDQAEIDGLVVCLASDDEKWQGLPHKNNPRVCVTSGGTTRAQSVLNGLAALKIKADDEDWVLVHDAARPCLRAELLQNFIKQVRETDDGGVLAVPAKDTLKISDKADGTFQITIQESLDRTNIWHAQTPQMFRFGAIEAALVDAIRDKHLVTDEASAMELAGYHPRLIEGDTANIKITTPGDLKLAEFLINEG